MKGVNDMKRRRGFVQLAILHLLDEEPKHGYQIMKELEYRSGGFYSASAGTVYPALQELMEQEMIELLPDTGKKIYSLGVRGRTRLTEHSNKKKSDFWEDWKARWEWQNSEEATQLKEVIDQWENELRKAIKASRKDKDSTSRLIEFIQDTTNQLQKEIQKKGEET